MSTESEPSTSELKASPSQPPRPKKKKKTKKAKIARPLDEREINAPDRQTLLMLGGLAGLAIVLWIFAHAGCNYHPPRETRRPRNVTTADLTREPKDAAIELQQRLLTHDYKGALEIAAGPLVKQVEQEKAACEADRTACDARKAASERAITMGVVLERQPMNAKVRVTTHNMPGGPHRFLTLVERDTTGWKITARVPDGPSAELPAPSLVGGNVQFAPMLPGSASAPTMGKAIPPVPPAGSGTPALPPGHP